MGYTLYIRNHVRKVLTKAKKRRPLTIISHVNTNESKKLKSPNIDYVKIRTISYFSNLEDGISSNTLINFPKRIDPESIFVSMTKYQFQMVSTKTIILINFIGHNNT